MNLAVPMVEQILKDVGTFEGTEVKASSPSSVSIWSADDIAQLEAAATVSASSKNAEVAEGGRKLLAAIAKEKAKHE